LLTQAPFFLAIPSFYQTHNTLISLDIDIVFAYFAPRRVALHSHPSFPDVDAHLPKDNQETAKKYAGLIAAISKPDQPSSRSNSPPQGAIKSPNSPHESPENMSFLMQITSPNSPPSPGTA
jgi:hypothetical protein